MKTNQPQVNHLAHVMPDWNGSESIVAYSIRQRKLRREREERAMLKRRAIWSLAGLIGLPAILLIGTIIGQAIGNAV